MLISVQEIRTINPTVSSTEPGTSHTVDGNPALDITIGIGNKFRWLYFLMAPHKYLTTTIIILQPLEETSKTTVRLL